MQITFDPLDQREADYVSRLIAHNVLSLPPTKVLAHADRPDVGASSEIMFKDAQHYPVTPESAAPLPPDAPSFAAVDLFPNVPAAATASAPLAPLVPSPPVPPAPPAPPAPAAPAAATSPVELDKNGLPWDERIHASTKTKNADLSWRQRRNLNDEALVKRVEAELRALLANNATSAAPLLPASGSEPTAAATSTPNTVPVPSPTPTSTDSVPNVPPAPAAATASVPPPPVTPAGPPAVPAPPVPAGASTPTAASAAPAASTLAPPASNFAELIDVISKSIAQGKLTEAQVNSQLEAEGVPPTAIGLLAGDPVKTVAVGKRLHVMLGGVV